MSTSDTVMARTRFPMNFNSWFVLVSKKTNTQTHLVWLDYTQWQLHFPYCVPYVFVKRLPRNFYSVARNSKIVSHCNFTLFGSQNAEKKNMETYFWDDPCIMDAGWWLHWTWGTFKIRNRFLSIPYCVASLLFLRYKKFSQWWTEYHNVCFLKIISAVFASKKLCSLNLAVSK